jgi:hypothetical protein
MFLSLTRGALARQILTLQEDFRDFFLDIFLWLHDMSCMHQPCMLLHLLEP